MGATHAAAYATLGEVQIRAVASRNERAISGDFSSIGGNLGSALPPVDFSSAAKYTDWEQVIADPSVEAVDVCAPTYLHEQISLAALDAGKHVFCEKPMALSAAACDRMLKARTKGQVLMIGHVLRFWPEYEELRESLSLGEYGRVRTATFTRVAALPKWSSWITDPAKSGGAVLDLLIHDLDQVVLLFGTPESVQAKRSGPYDGVLATFSYPNGLMVQLEGGWMGPDTPFAMGYKIETDRACFSLNPNQPVQIPVTEAYREELSYFQRCCDEGRQPERCPPEESAAAVRLAMLVQECRDCVI